MGEVGCLIEKEFLEGCDIDVPSIDRDGRRYYRKFRHEEEYQTFFGKVRVERTVYQANGDNLAICPMEERAGVIHHNSTPLAQRPRLTYTGLSHFFRGFSAGC